MYLDDQLEPAAEISSPPTTVSRLHALLCSYDLHKWTFWKPVENVTFLGAMPSQQRRCINCGKTEEVSFYSENRFYSNQEARI